MGNKVRCKNSFLLMVAIVSACAESISPNNKGVESEPEGEVSPAEGPDEGGKTEADSTASEPAESVGKKSDGDDIIYIEIDASDENTWSHFDLEMASKVGDNDANWDIAFQRFNIRINGGASGEGGVETNFVDNESIETILTIPTAGWTTDAADANGDGSPEYAFEDWYDYDISTHVLSPKDRVWFVRSTDDRVFALEILDYYDDAGTSGFPSFCFQEIF